VSALPFEQARGCVVEQVLAGRGEVPSEEVPLEAACGRVLAEPAYADRDYPPVARSLRDGFALRSVDTPGKLRVVGEVRAGEVFQGVVRPGEAVEIMTGAPVPAGADAVIMIERVRREGQIVAVEEPVPPGQWINARASEAARGELLLEAGRRIGYAEVAMLATLGHARVRVYRPPRVAVLPTGDEIVELDQQPLDHQIRNSNAYSLGAQIRRAGGLAELLPVAPDEIEPMRALISRAREADLLLISGGVSAGKYDLVERVLAALGAQFYFRGVLMQPGYPLVFGRLDKLLFFGLPGNPVCTMLSFELFARAAMELLEGRKEVGLPLLWTRLAAPFRHKPGLTRFVRSLVFISSVPRPGMPVSGCTDN